MSVEQTPNYHYPRHLETYDIDTPRKAWGHISMLTEMLDDILYAGGTTIQPHKARANEGLFESFFTYEYPRSEVSISGLSSTPEYLRVSIEHARYLGTAAVKQAYKVKLDSTVRRPAQERIRITTIYHLEEVAGVENTFLGAVLKPNIIGEENPTQETITVYDCHDIANYLGEVVALIRLDQQLMGHEPDTSQVY